MMNKKGSIIFLLVALMLVGGIASPAFASDFGIDNNGIYTDGDYSNGEMVNGVILYKESLGTEIIKIIPSNDKISSNGTFDFDVAYSLKSSNFGVSSTSACITMTPYIENPQGQNVTDDYPNHDFTIALYEDHIIPQKIGTRYGYANDVEKNFYFSGLDTSEEYYFVITNVDYLPQGTTISGDGSISDYVHL